jgi:hypothetical protein
LFSIATDIDCVVVSSFSSLSSSLSLIDFKLVYTFVSTLSSSSFSSLSSLLLRIGSEILIFVSTPSSSSLSDETDFAAIAKKKQTFYLKTKSKKSYELHWYIELM